jgi:hypothetical protein
MLPLLLTRALVPADHPGNLLDTRTTLAYDLTTMSEAERLHQIGQPALFLIELDSLPGEHDGFTLYDCGGADTANRTVWLYGGELDGDRLIVRATLRIIPHLPQGEF